MREEAQRGETTPEGLGKGSRCRGEAGRHSTVTPTRPTPKHAPQDPSELGENNDAGQQGVPRQPHLGAKGFPECRSKGSSWEGHGQEAGPSLEPGTSTGETGNAETARASPWPCQDSKPRGAWPSRPLAGREAPLAQTFWRAPSTPGPTRACPQLRLQDTHQERPPRTGSKGASGASRAGTAGPGCMLTPSDRKQEQGRSLRTPTRPSSPHHRSGTALGLAATGRAGPGRTDTPSPAHKPSASSGDAQGMEGRRLASGTSLGGGTWQSPCFASRAL